MGVDAKEGTQNDFQGTAGKRMEDGITTGPGMSTRGMEGRWALPDTGRSRQQA